MLVLCHPLVLAAAVFVLIGEWLAQVNHLAIVVSNN